MTGSSALPFVAPTGRDIVFINVGGRQFTFSVFNLSPNSKSKETFGMENAHLSALTAKHAGLDAQIDHEQQRPLPDGPLIAMLKKQKLKIKEAMLIR